MTIKKKKMNEKAQIGITPVQTAAAVRHQRSLVGQRASPGRRRRPDSASRITAKGTMLLPRGRGRRPVGALPTQTGPGPAPGPPRSTRGPRRRPRRRRRWSGKGPGSDGEDERIPRKTTTVETHHRVQARLQVKLRWYLPGHNAGLFLLTYVNLFFINCLACRNEFPTKLWSSWLNFGQTSHIFSASCWIVPTWRKKPRIFENSSIRKKM